MLQLMRDKAEQLLEVPAQQVQEDRSFVDDLQVDSLALVEYTMDLEDALGIEFARGGARRPRHDRRVPRRDHEQAGHPP